jgi:hypothetical protein
VNFAQPEYESCPNCGAILDIKKATKCPTCETTLNQRITPPRPKFVFEPEKEYEVDYTSEQFLNLIRSKNRREFEIFDQDGTRLMYSKLSVKFDPINVFRLMITAFRALRKEIPVFELHDKNQQLMGKVSVKTSRGGISTGSIRNSHDEVIATFSGRWGSNLSSFSSLESEIDAFVIETDFESYTISVIRERTGSKQISRIDILDRNRDLSFSIKPQTIDKFVIHFSDSHSRVPLLIVGTTCFAVVGMFFV